MTIASQVSNTRLAGLLARVANGDRAAFQELYEETSPKFLAIVTRILRDEDRALDVLQEAYVSIWRHAGRFDPNKGRAFTWMLVVMRNRALDTLRSTERSETLTELTAEVPDTADGPEEVVRRTAMWEIVQTHMRDLPDSMASAITLRICYGQDYKEIADALCSTPNTVKSWVRRGLIRLRKQLPIDGVSAVI